MNKKNRNIVLICILLVLVILLVAFFVKKKQTSDIDKLRFKQQTIIESSTNTQNDDKSEKNDYRESMTITALDMQTENIIKEIIAKNEKQNRHRGKRENNSMDIDDSRNEKNINSTLLQLPSIDDEINTSNMMTIQDGNNETIKNIIRNAKIKSPLYFDYGSYLEIINSTDISSIIEKYKKSEHINTKEYELLNAIISLNDIIKQAPQNGNIKILLIGHTDPSYWNGIPEISENSNLFNTELSKKRANTIKTILAKNFSINYANIFTLGLGYRGYEKETTELWKYRRVDIYILW